MDSVQDRGIGIDSSQADIPFINGMLRDSHPAACEEPETKSPPKRKYGFPQIFSGRTKEDPEFEQRRHELLDGIKSILAKGLQSEDVQSELSRIAGVLENLESCSQQERVGYLSLAVAALKCDKPNLVFAQAIRSESEFMILKSQRGIFRGIYRIAGNTPLSAMLSGVISSGISMLLATLIIALILSYFSWVMQPIKALNLQWEILFIMAVMAAGGSFVSVISRLSQVSVTKNYDPFLIFFTGFFKPWIGVAFSLFVFFALESKILNLSALVAAGDKDFVVKASLYNALAFVCGFSERFVSDFITKTEGRLLGPATPTTGSGTEGRAAAGGR